MDKTTRTLIIITILLAIGFILLLAVNFTSAAPVHASSAGMANGAACDVYAWDTSRVWFVWRNAPAGVDYVTTYRLAEMPQAREIVTSSDSGWYTIGSDIYTTTLYDFGESDYRISALTCIARQQNGESLTAYNGASWFQYITRLPAVQR